MSKDEDVRLTELFLRWTSGDEEAGKQFWGSKTWEAQVNNYCGHICRMYPLPGGDFEQNVKDLAQQASRRMIEKRAQFRGSAPVGAWFRIIAKRLHFREFSKGQREREILRKSACQARIEVADEIPGVRLAVMEAWDSLSLNQKELYEVFLQCGDAVEVAQVLKGSQWLLLSNYEQDKEVARVRRQLKEIQKKLTEPAEVKWLTVFEPLEVKDGGDSYN